MWKAANGYFFVSTWCQCFVTTCIILCLGPANLCYLTGWQNRKTAHYWSVKTNYLMVWQAIFSYRSECDAWNLYHQILKYVCPGSSHAALKGVKSIMGMPSKKCAISLNGKSEADLSKLHLFYNHFNVQDFSKLSVFENVAFSVHVDKSAVQRPFRLLNIRKSPGSDRIGSCLLKNCVWTACRYFQFYFHLVTPAPEGPCFWKDSIIVPVPKSNAPKTPNDYNPVVLATLIMKSFGKDCKGCSSEHCPCNFGPASVCLQARQRRWRCHKHSFNMILSFLEGAKTWSVFFLLICHRLLAGLVPYPCRKAQSVHIEPSLIGWLMDFLTGRP